MTKSFQKKKSFHNESSLTLNPLLSFQDLLIHPRIRCPGQEALNEIFHTTTSHVTTLIHSTTHTTHILVNRIFSEIHLCSLLISYISYRDSRYNITNIYFCQHLIINFLFLRRFFLLLSGYSLYKNVITLFCLVLSFVVLLTFSFIYLDSWVNYRFILLSLFVLLF